MHEPPQAGLQGRDSVAIPLRYARPPLETIFTWQPVYRPGDEMDGVSGSTREQRVIATAAEGAWRSAQ
ncbi:hypothetical protein MANY_07660 [Mycolicibacterium anyangense]|uniref:Uncharacterized protein n=1 Tax=Mycolicibacterium anyangense TaxID=1431246 RepID=A0A6N4W356_9MYCO|nr:hypothetical protein MANY_07660 [Mycolicibacterium anyangense]